MRVVFLSCVLFVQSFQVSAASDKRLQNSLKTYADIAWLSYRQAVTDLKKLDRAIIEFTSSPSQEGLEKSRKAWLQSRESYGLTEAFRLSGGPIDAEHGWVAELYGSLEGQINGWPLDERMIDSTIEASGEKTRNNIVSHTEKFFTPSGKGAKAVPVSPITPQSLKDLNENGSDANIASGYHAIEFLLWGQDQDYSNFAADKVTPGALQAGDRSWKDYIEPKLGKRRIAYLRAASSKLLHDLDVVSEAWNPGKDWTCSGAGRGCYRRALLSQLTAGDKKKNIKPEDAVRSIIKGLGVFIKSELANERIAVAVLTPSEEDEHSCFSDNTHRDITRNFQGFLNILTGRYADKRVGSSFYDYVPSEDRSKLDQLVDQITAEIDKMNHLASTKWHFDYQILPQNNAKGIKKMKNRMRRLGDSMILVAKGVNLRLNKSDVTDAEETKI